MKGLKHRNTILDVTFQGAFFFSKFFRFQNVTRSRKLRSKVGLFQKNLDFKT
jgi:hypothetical protein